MCLLSEYEMAMTGLCRWKSKSKISGEVLMWKKDSSKDFNNNNHLQPFWDFNGGYGNLYGNEPLKDTIINVVLYDSMMFW